MEIEELKSIAAPILEEGGLFLVDLKLGKGNVIEIFIDSLQGVDIQTCVDTSRRIEACLDRDKEDFELTVSSAGIGYPFLVEGQYRKNLGKAVEVKFMDSSRLEGILKAYDGESVTLTCEERKAVEGKKKKETVITDRVIRKEDIREIRDVVVF